MTDRLFTRCPECSTVFRVSLSQLESAKGHVRCGACLQVFKAIDHRVVPKSEVNENSNPQQKIEPTHSINDSIADKLGSAFERSEVTEDSTILMEKNTDSSISDSRQFEALKISDEPESLDALEQTDDSFLDDESDLSSTEPSTHYEHGLLSASTEALYEIGRDTDKSEKTSFPIDSFASLDYEQIKTNSDAFGSDSESNLENLSEPRVEENEVELKEQALNPLPDEFPSAQDMDFLIEDHNSNITSSELRRDDSDNDLVSSQIGREQFLAELSEEQELDEEFVGDLTSDDILPEELNNEETYIDEDGSEQEFAEEYGVTEESLEQQNELDDPFAGLDDLSLQAEPRFGDPNDIEPSLSIDDLNANLEGQDLEPDPLDEFDDFVHKQSHLKKILMLAAVVIALLIWGIVYLWSNREALAYTDNMGGLVHTLCAIAPCDLPPRRDVKAIDLVQRQIRPNETAPALTDFVLQIRNTASFSQPYPSIVVKFTNTQGEVITQEIHQPNEYLASEFVNTMMEPNQLVQVKLLSKQRQAAALGFEFDFQ